MIHRIEQHFAVEHVDVHVVSRSAEERVEYARQIRDPVFGDAAEPLRHYAWR